MCLNITRYQALYERFLLLQVTKVFGKLQTTVRVLVRTICSDSSLNFLVEYLVCDISFVVLGECFAVYDSQTENQTRWCFQLIRPRGLIIKRIEKSSLWRVAGSTVLVPWKKRMCGPPVRWCHALTFIVPKSQTLLFFIFEMVTDWELFLCGHQH